MNENQITLINEKGEEELANIIFTHNENGKHYIVFQFVSTGEYSAALYEETSETEGKLLDIETDEELEMLNDLLDEFLDEELLEDE